MSSAASSRSPSPMPNSTSMDSPSSSSTSTSSDELDYKFAQDDIVSPDRLMDFYDQYTKLKEAVKDLDVPHTIGMSSEGELLLYLQQPERKEYATPVRLAARSHSQAIREPPKRKQQTTVVVSEVAKKAEPEVPIQRRKTYFRMTRLTDNVINWKVEEVSYEEMMKDQEESKEKKNEDMVDSEVVNTTDKEDQNQENNDAAASITSKNTEASVPPADNTQPAATESTSTSKRLTMKVKVSRDEVASLLASVSTAAGENKNAEKPETSRTIAGDPTDDEGFSLSDFANEVEISSFSTVKTKNVETDSGILPVITANSSSSELKGDEQQLQLSSEPASGSATSTESEVKTGSDLNLEETKLKDGNQHFPASSTVSGSAGSGQRAPRCAAQFKASEEISANEGKPPFQTTTTTRFRAKSSPPDLGIIALPPPPPRVEVVSPAKPIQTAEEKYVVDNTDPPSPVIDEAATAVPTEGTNSKKNDNTVCNKPAHPDPDEIGKKKDGGGAKGKYSVFKYMCPEVGCLKSFKDLKLLNRHSLSHEIVTVYKCFQCSGEFKNIRGIKVHMQEAHPLPPPQSSPSGSFRKDMEKPFNSRYFLNTCNRNRERSREPQPHSSNAVGHRPSNEVGTRAAKFTLDSGINSPGPSTSVSTSDGVLDTSSMPAASVHDERDDRTVFICNLASATSDANIREFLAGTGTIEKLTMARDFKGRFRGYCHVCFSTTGEATAALEKNGLPLGPRIAFVSMCDRAKQLDKNAPIPVKPKFTRGRGWRTASGSGRPETSGDSNDLVL